MTDFNSDPPVDWCLSNCNDEFLSGAEFQPSKRSLFDWHVIPVEVLMLGHTRSCRREKNQKRACVYGK